MTVILLTAYTSGPNDSKQTKWQLSVRGVSAHVGVSTFSLNSITELRSSEIPSLYLLENTHKRKRKCVGLKMLLKRSYIPTLNPTLRHLYLRKNKHTNTQTSNLYPTQV